MYLEKTENIVKAFFLMLKFTRFQKHFNRIYFNINVGYFNIDKQDESKQHSQYSDHQFH